MKRVIIKDYGVFLGAQGDRILVRKSGQKLAEIPAGNVSQLVLTTKGIGLSTGLLRLLLKYQVDLVLLSESGRLLGRLIWPMGRAVLLRKNQLAAQSDWRGIYLAKQFAKAKLLNQSYLLRSLAKNRKSSQPQLASKLMDYSDRIQEYVAKMELLELSDLDQLRPQLMALEADGSNLYWEAIAELLEGVVEFPGRRKRTEHPSDPVNIMLNYGYSFLFSEIWRSLELAALDPYFGFLHTDSPRRPALAADLIEEFRQPVVDRAVLRLVQEQSSRLEELIQDGKLTSKARGMLLESLGQRLEQKVTFLNRNLPIKAQILLQARRLGLFLGNKSSDYQPFLLKW